MMFFLVISCLSSQEVELSSRLPFVCYKMGAVLALIILCANLGALAYPKLPKSPIFASMNEEEKWPCVLCTTRPGLRSILGYVLSVIIGLFVPYLGLQSVNCGGQIGQSLLFRDKKADNLYNQSTDASMRGTSKGRKSIPFVMLSSIFTAGVLVALDMPALVSYLGLTLSDDSLDTSTRGIINFGLGVWWTLSTSLSLLFCHINFTTTQNAVEFHPTMVRNDTSPTGYIVPSLPIMTVDPKSVSRIEDEDDNWVISMVENLCYCWCDPEHIATGWRTISLLVVEFIYFSVIGGLGTVLIWQSLNQMRSDSRSSIDIESHSYADSASGAVWDYGSI